MQFLETDVLVIGGGGAGAMSTLHASAQGVKVEVQAVPTQKPLPLERLFKACHVTE